MLSQGRSSTTSRQRRAAATRQSRIVAPSPLEEIPAVSRNRTCSSSPASRGRTKAWTAWSRCQLLTTLTWGAFATPSEVFVGGRAIPACPLTGFQAVPQMAASRSLCSAASCRPTRASEVSRSRRVSRPLTRRARRAPRGSTSGPATGVSRNRWRRNGAWSGSLRSLVCPPSTAPASAPCPAAPTPRCRAPCRAGSPAAGRRRCCRQA
mmetsp:Transcript_34588/g.87465  ORF Transcript_34588/g.87465 Transcript_34588/m.87465 type:complete len:208 (-) Transcript_34588:208-831(-)